MILLSESSWRDCFRRTCFLTIFFATIDMVKHTAKNYQYLRNCKKNTFLLQKSANMCSTKALRDYFALAESQPTPGTLMLFLCGISQNLSKFAQSSTVNLLIQIIHGDLICSTGKRRLCLKRMNELPTLKKLNPLDN